MSFENPAMPLPSRRARRQTSDVALPTPKSSVDSENVFQLEQEDELSDFSFDIPDDTPVKAFDEEEFAAWGQTEDQSDFAIPETPSYGLELETDNERSVAPVLQEVQESIVIKSSEEAENLSIDDMLLKLLEEKGSDLHLSARAHPTIRVNGEMQPMTEFPRLSGEQIQRAITSIMTTNQRNRFEEDWELDFAYNLPGHSRFRINVMKQRTQTSAVLRAIPWEIKTVEQLGLPSTLVDWANLRRGLVLITGPTGSGKSTTLAAIIDHANRNRAGHIVTIEDPIEFVHDHQRSIINQREVGEDTKSFAAALKHVLRQDPDIILVGELRDLETISVALTAAETGHLVFATLHTQSAEETITRIVDVFPEGEQQQVRTQLAGTLQGVACQSLLKTVDGNSRVAAVEIMVGTSAIKAQIRENKIQQIPSTLQSGGKYGMQTMDSVLEKLVKERKVRWQDAADLATNRDKFITTLGGETATKRLDHELRGNRGGLI
jgi:twitching motility protein PilT